MNDDFSFRSNLQFKVEPNKDRSFIKLIIKKKGTRRTINIKTKRKLFKLNEEYPLMPNEIFLELLENLDLLEGKLYLDRLPAPT